MAVLVGVVTGATASDRAVRPGGPDRRRAALAVVGWVVLVVVAVRWGQVLLPGRGAAIGAPPFLGHWDLRLGTGLVPPFALGAVVVAFGPRVAATARWRDVVVASVAASAAWTVALASADGWERVTSPLAGRHEYEPYAAVAVADVPGFLRTFVDRFGDHPVHVRGHPPGAVLLAAGLDRLGLGGAGWLAVLCIGGWAAAAGIVLVVARRVAGEAAARRAAPALVVLPAAVWAGTSVDGLYAGVGAAALAATIAAITSGRHAMVVGAGFAVAAALLGSYGFVPLLAVPATVAVVAVDRRRAALRLVAVGAAAGGVLVLVAVATGFWWLDGLAATREAYWSGRAALRPGGYFTLAGNPGALAVAAGPAVAVGLASIRRSPLAVLPVAAGVAVLAADLSQLSRAEVERIWLPFVPWLALAAPGHRRGWLAAQVAVGVTIQAWLRSPW